MTELESELAEVEAFRLAMDKRLDALNFSWLAGEFDLLPKEERFRLQSQFRYMTDAIVVLRRVEMVLKERIEKGRD